MNSNLGAVKKNRQTSIAETTLFVLLVRGFVLEHMQYHARWFQHVAAPFVSILTLRSSSQLTSSKTSRTLRVLGRAEDARPF